MSHTSGTGKLVDWSAHPSVQFKVIRRHPDAVLPARAHATDAGWDVASCEPEFLLQPGRRKAVDTGLAFEIPPGYEIQVRSRSGLAIKHGVMVLNSPGTLDAGYIGNLKIILANFGDEPIWVKTGMRLAQIVFAAVLPASVAEGTEADLTDTERGSQGFGSSGG